MRRLVLFLLLFLLTCLLALASLPQSGQAGARMHDCPSCPAQMTAPHAMPDPGTQESAQTRHCADMAPCAAAAILADPVTLTRLVAPRLPAGRPGPRLGTAIAISLDLPPPRA